MRKILLIIVFCLIYLNIYSQAYSPKNYKLIVHLHNAPFNSLALLDYRDLHNVIIEGKNIEKFKWEFIIPDSIVENSEFMMLFVPEKDTISDAFHQIRFNHEFKNKKNSIANIGIQDETNYIEGDYKASTLFKKENITSFSGHTDSIIIGNLICDDFDLKIKNDNSDISVRSFEPYYAWFDNNLSYKDQIQYYINLSKSYPDSRYLITYLALNLQRFKSRQDVKSIYQNFSNKLATSKWALRIERFLSDDFQNISLINLDLGVNELIIKDSLKYNLVVFAASWCGPCIEEIPLLKKLHKDFKAHLNFTYISMDYEKDVKAFKKLLIENDVPWRTLYAYKDLERVKDLFSITTIPHSLLVYPNGQIEVIDIRLEANQKKLSLLK